MPPIIFTDADFYGVNQQQDDPKVITINLENFAEKKVLTDWMTYQKLQLPATAMVPYDEPTYSFSREKVSIHGYIDLHAVFREGSQTKTIPICFVVVEAPTSYNVLLGRPSLNTLDAVVSTPYLVMKFPSPSKDIITIHGDQRLAHECYMVSFRPQLPILQTHNIECQPSSGITLSGEDLDPRVGCDLRIEPVEETRNLELSPGHILKLGTCLQQEHHNILTPTLTTNVDLFT